MSCRICIERELPLKSSFLRVSHPSSYPPSHPGSCPSSHVPRVPFERRDRTDDIAATVAQAIDPAAAGSSSHPGSYPSSHPGSYPSSPSSDRWLCRALNVPRKSPRKLPRKSGEMPALPAGLASRSSSRARTLLRPETA